MKRLVKSEVFTSIFGASEGSLTSNKVCAKVARGIRIFNFFERTHAFDHARDAQFSTMWYVMLSSSVYFCNEMNDVNCAGSL